MATCGDTLVSNEDFKELKVMVSEWFDQRVCISYLKVLYSDLLSPFELDSASKTMDLLNSLTDLDELNSTNLNLLYDTIVVSRHFGLVKKIKKKLPSCPFPTNIKDIEISSFTPHRLKLMKLGSLLTEDVAKIDGLYNEPPKNYTDSWSLIMDLEKRTDICEGKMEKFVEKLEKLELKAAVDALCRGNGEASTSKRSMLDKGNGDASTSKRPKLDKGISDHLIAWQKKMYEDLNLINPAIWNKEYDIDIAHLFTDLNILKSKRDDKGQPNMGRCEISTTLAARTHQNKSTLAEVLGVIESIDSCKVLITGQGGMGKTTLLRYISHNWATGKDNNFGGKLLFLINVRDLKPSKKFLELLLEQINVEEITLKNQLQTASVKNFLVMHAAKIVILLDGYDELERDAKDPISLFKGFEFRESIVVMTSRPENIACLLKICDVHIEVKGFSQTNIENYIHKYFDSINASESMGNSLISKLHRHNVAFNLCSSPLLLLKICTIWEQKQLIPKDLTDLFKELFCCILNQYIRKHSNIAAISEFDRIPEKCLSAILVLGQCMYEGLKKNTLSIEKHVLTTMVESEDSVDLALKFGFVYKNSPVALDDLTEIYTPPHKLLTEALVGFYLSVQIKQGSLEASEYEVIRSNEYLHMVREFTIGFLGADAGKLLTNWLFINTASDYRTIVKYFNCVKKEFSQPVLHTLDQNMLPHMKKHFKQMCELVLEVYCFGGSKKIERKDVHYLKCMSDLYGSLEYSVKVDLLLMRTLETKLPTECVIRMLVHIFILFERIYDSAHFKMYLRYLASFNDKEIDTLSGTMEELKFKYTVKIFEIETNFHPKFLIHLLSTASKLTFLYLYYRYGMFMTGVVLNAVFITLHENQVLLKLETIGLSNNDLSGISGVSLACLFKIAPNLRHINLNNCKLSGKILKTMVTECQRYQLALGLNYIHISNNDLRDIDGESLANLFKIAPKLRQLDISFCKLTRFVGYLLNVCDMIGVVLRLKGNDLSDIDSLLFPKLLKAADLDYYYSYNAQQFTWSDYCFTSNNLKGLVNSCARDDTLPWEVLDLSGTNLSSINGITLACLFKMSPLLKHLNMRNCTLSGSTIQNMMTECDKIGVVLKDIIFELNGNDLSDIDGPSLVKVVRMLCVGIGSRDKFMHSLADYFFTWSDFCFSSQNLQDLVNSWDGDVTLPWEGLDLSRTDLASINGKIIARLFKISPHLKHLDMNDCNLHSSTIKHFLNECDRIGASLDEVILGLKNNDLSGIDDSVSFAKLVRMISKYDYVRERTGRYIYSFKWHDYCLSADNLNNLMNACSNVILPWRMLDLSEINLSSVNELTLASLFKISLELKHLNMNNCKLSGSIMRKILNKCDKIGAVLKDNMLGLRGNDLSDIDGQTLAKLVSMIDTAQWSDYCFSSIHLQNLIAACGEGVRISWRVLKLSGVNLSSIDKIGLILANLFKISPNLEQLELNNCNLSGSIMRDVLSECDRIGVALKDNMLELGSNDLSNIDGQTFAKLARLISREYFKWSDYSLSCDNLQDLLGLHSVRLPWKYLYLDDTNLASINGIKLENLFIICPELSYLDMSNCKLSGSSCRYIMNNRYFDEYINKRNFLNLKRNDLSDIDGQSLAKLIYVDKFFKLSDYCLSFNNLNDLIGLKSVSEDAKLPWLKLDLSGINLASVNVLVLAQLIKNSSELVRLNMSNCSLSGSFMSNVLKECDKIGVVLKNNCFIIKDNNLSDIDGRSLSKLVKLIQPCDSDYFKWSDYCFTSDNLQDLLELCEDVRLPSKMLDLSGINLAVVNGLTCLFTIFSELSHLKMVDCNMSYSNMRDVLKECGKIGIALIDKEERRV